MSNRHYLYFNRFFLHSSLKRTAGEVQIFLFKCMPQFVAKLLSYPDERKLCFFHKLFICSLYPFQPFPFGERSETHPIGKITLHCPFYAIYNKILLLQIQPDLHLNGVGWGGLPSAIQQPHISCRLLQGDKKQAASLKGLSHKIDKKLGKKLQDQA